MARLIEGDNIVLDSDTYFTTSPDDFQVHDESLRDYLKHYYSDTFSFRITEKDASLADGAQFQVLVERGQNYDCHLITNEIRCTARVSPGPKRVGHVSGDGHHRFTYRPGGQCVDLGREFDCDVLMVIEVPLRRPVAVATRSIGLGARIGDTSVADNLPYDTSQPIEVTVWRILCSGPANKIFRL